MLARHNSSWFKGEPALTEHAVGKGRVLHWGACFSAAAVSKLLACTGVMDPFRGIIGASEHVELIMREKDGRRFVFALNYKPWKETIRLYKPAKSLETDETCEGDVILPAYGVAVFEIG